MTQKPITPEQWIRAIFKAGVTKDYLNEFLEMNDLLLDDSVLEYLFIKKNNISRFTLHVQNYEQLSIIMYEDSGFIEFGYVPPTVNSDHGKRGFRLSSGFNKSKASAVLMKLLPRIDFTLKQ